MYMYMSYHIYRERKSEREISEHIRGNTAFERIWGIRSDRGGGAG